MLSFKSLTWARIIFSAVLVGVALMAAVPADVYGIDEIDLELGGAGATPWHISNIKPGDSGSMTVELHNAGSEPGNIFIWVEDITGSDPGGDGLGLEQYLYLDLDCASLYANMPLPARITELPQSASDSEYLCIGGPGAGETVTLTWEWEFLETGLPQNDAQGDSLSFNINYLLTSMDIPPPQTTTTTTTTPPPPPSGDPEYLPPNPAKRQWLQIDILGHITLAEADEGGAMVKPYTASDSTGRITMQFQAGTVVTISGGVLPSRIRMKEASAPDGLSDELLIIGPSYQLTGYKFITSQLPVYYSRPVRLTLRYDGAIVPNDNTAAKIASMDEAAQWTVLETADGSGPNDGEVSAMITGGSWFGVVAADISSPPVTTPPVSTPLSEPAPAWPETPPEAPPTVTSSAPASPVITHSAADFEILDLVIEPKRVEPGAPVSISIDLWNAGGSEGEYLLELKIDGETEYSRETVLEAGERRRIEVNVTRNLAGVHTVTAGEQSAEFTVGLPEAAVSRSKTLLISVSAAIAAAGLLVYLLTTKFKSV